MDKQEGQSSRHHVMMKQYVPVVHTAATVGTIGTHCFIENDEIPALVAMCLKHLLTI